MPTIPDGFQPVVQGYGIGAPDGVLRTDVAGGAPRYGLEWDRGVQQYRVTLVLNSLQFAVWTAFFHHVIKKGALAFDMDLDSGFGPQSHSVNIMPGSYSASRTGTVMTSVSFIVEAESAAYGWTTAEAVSFVALYNEFGPRLGQLLDRISLFANFDTVVLA
jgi:hypothetical protein